MEEMNEERGADVAASPFGFRRLVQEAEVRMVSALGLEPLRLDPALARAAGRWRGAAVHIETRAYRGGVVRFARFTTTAQDRSRRTSAARTRGVVEIGSVLCMADPRYPLPILRADLLALGRDSATLAVDLPPTLPPGAERDAQLAPLATSRARRAPLPSGGALPRWDPVCLSSQAVHSQFGPEAIDEVAGAVRDFLEQFVALAEAAVPRQDLVAQVVQAQSRCAAAHRAHASNLGLLARLFGRQWSERYVAEVLCPPADALSDLRLALQGSHPVATRFDPGIGAEDRTPGTSLSYSYYRED